MIRKIHFTHYRKLINVDLNFSKGINAIAGTNGTCKSSLLYIVSNSFQSVGARSETLSDHSCVKVINALNDSVNTKIESLVRDAKKYNDPAAKTSGSLFTVDYFSGQSVPFRKHNSEKDFRFALKPYYKRGMKESLPCCPVIYLGISRLLPFGESSDELTISKINKKLPEKYQNILASLFNEFTHYDMHIEKPVSVEKFKKRTEFSTEVEGIDSNTISAGEDNLSIILTALVSLQYYYDSLVSSNNDVESVLLVDELDATLHPTFQRKLLNYIKEFSKNYKIQVFFTTHNYNLLDYTMRNKDNVVYLYDNRSFVYPLDNPDWPTIKMHLEGIDENGLFMNCKIPILLEDDEARWLFRAILNNWQNKNPEFAWIINHMHLVEVKAGADVLKGLFSDCTLNIQTIGWICILDGDKQEDIPRCILALPGKKSIEQFLYEYALKLYNEDDNYWISADCIEHGISKTYFLDEIKKKYDEIEESIRKKEEAGESTRGMRRTLFKSFFNDKQYFFQDILNVWMKKPENQNELMDFYKNLGILYKKVCNSWGLPSKYWPDDYDGHC